jgi:hypothetical protein
MARWEKRARRQPPTKAGMHAYINQSAQRCNILQPCNLCRLSGRHTKWYMAGCLLSSMHACILSLAQCTAHLDAHAVVLYMLMRELHYALKTSASAGRPPSKPRMWNAGRGTLQHGR